MPGTKPSRATQSRRVEPITSVEKGQNPTCVLPGFVLVFFFCNREELQQHGHLGQAYSATLCGRSSHDVALVLFDCNVSMVRVTLALTLTLCLCFSCRGSPLTPESCAAVCMTWTPMCVNLSVSFQPTCIHDSSLTFYNLTD